MTGFRKAAKKPKPPKVLTPNPILIKEYAQVGPPIRESWLLLA